MAKDVNGNDVSGQCDCYPGAGYDGLFYSSINLNPTMPFYEFRPPSPDRNNWRLRFIDATAAKFGEGVTMEARNVSDYRPINPRANGFRGNMLQMNLAPTYSANGANDYFRRLIEQAGIDLSLNPPPYPITTNTTNMVALWYRFVSTTTGEDVELEEFTVSIFDFDQAWADGDRGTLRESIFISGWTTVFLTNTSELEMTYTHVPVRTVTGCSLYVSSFVF